MTTSNNRSDTPVRSVRIGDLWSRCAALAARRGERMTTLVIRALEAEEQRLGAARAGGQADGEVERVRGMGLAALRGAVRAHATAVAEIEPPPGGAGRLHRAPLRPHPRRPAARARTQLDLPLRTQLDLDRIPARLDRQPRRPASMSSEAILLSPQSVGPCAPPDGLRRGEAFTCPCGTRWMRLGAQPGLQPGWLDLGPAQANPAQAT
jgi:hypothetical protein